jgi:branched-chain amino acid transport system substrate-binding protein
MQGVRRPHWRTVVLAVAFALLAAACGGGGGQAGSQAAGEEGCPPGGVALGFFGALTGPNAALGINIRNGAKLAIDQYMAGNPTCPVRLVEYDSQGSEDQAPALAIQAVQDQNVVAIIGPAFSGESRTANPIFNEAGLPLVTPSATGVSLSQNGWDVFHRAVGNDNAQGPAAAQYISNELQAQEVAVIDDASEYGKGIADLVREELGNTVVFNDAIDPQAQDYSSTVNGIKSASPDAIFYGGYYAEGGRLLKQLRDAGVTATFVSDDGALDTGFIQAAGQRQSEGALLTCPCAPVSQVDGGEAFQKAYVEAFNSEPGTYSTEGYDAANLLLEGIKQGNFDRASMNAFLDRVRYEGLTKVLQFDETGEVNDPTVYVYEIQGGEITPVGPIE